MAYIDSKGNVCDKKQRGIIETIMSFFTFIWLFFASLLGLDSRPNSYQATSLDYRNQIRGNGGNTYRGGYGGGGGDGMRRNIGRLPDQSGLAPPPMGGGCCGGGGCG